MIYDPTPPLLVAFDMTTPEGVYKYEINQIGLLMWEAHKAIAQATDIIGEPGGQTYQPRYKELLDKLATTVLALCDVDTELLRLQSVAEQENGSRDQ